MWKCPNGCEVTEVEAFIPGEAGACGVMIDAETGKSTNHWGDGTRGVTAETAIIVEEDESPMCSNCFAFCDWVEN